MPLTVCDHPLARHLISQLRDQATQPAEFRHASRILSTILVLEATKNLKLGLTEIQTPLEMTKCEILTEGLAVVPVLRAGLGMLDPILETFPDVAVGYIGLERDEETAEAHSYYCKLPKLPGRMTLCLDPMLATGGSASQALTLLKENGANPLSMVCVIASPEGVARLEEDHPDVPVVVAALDRELNSQKYIMPGLGDFGDRLFGTMGQK
jgi:uracil phosphoribosyltransferase